LAFKHDIGIKWHHCHLCDYKGKQTGNLKAHMSAAHNIGVTWHQCDLCDSKFKQKHQLKSHLADIHNIGVTWFKCDLCDYKAKKKGHIKQHMTNKHNIGVTWFKCDHCNYKGKQKGHLQVHLAATHDIGDKYCDICYEHVGRVRSIKGAKVCRSCCDDYGFMKERIELKYIKVLKVRFPYHMEHDTRVQGDMCLRYRPDAMWLDPHLKCHIQFELDEHQHLWKNGSYDCDEKRISDIYDEFKSNVPEHFVVVRLNPDSELGRAAVFKDRLNHLVEVLEHVKTSPPKEKISIIYMYYDKNNHRIAKNLPKYLLDEDNMSIQTEVYKQP
tara:strand:+ start:4270 stop:5250 length:981 start_codon:yes stop_codon:yes gene_type:complete